MLLQSLEDLKAVGVLLLVIFIVIFMAVFALMIGINAVKGERTSFGEVFLTGLIMLFLVSLITFVFELVLPQLGFLGTLAALIVGLFVIQSRHNTTFLGALGAIFIYAIMLVVLYYLLVFVFSSVLAIITNLLGFDLSNLIQINVV